MKNILIITTCRDNQGSHNAFVKDINDIKEDDLRDCVKNTISGINSEYGDLWTFNGEMGSERGYCFNDYHLRESMLPLTIDHIVNHSC